MKSTPSVTSHVSPTSTADSPDEPRDVKIDKFDKGSVTLKWKPPMSDGGNPIQGIYTNEKAV